MSLKKIPIRENNEDRIKSVYIVFQAVKYKNTKILQHVFSTRVQAVSYLKKYPDFDLTIKSYDCL